MHYTKCTRLVKAGNRHLYILYVVSDCAEGNVMTVCGLTVALPAAALILAEVFTLSAGQRVKRELGSNGSLSFMKHSSNFTMCHVSENVNI